MKNRTLSDVSGSVVQALLCTAFAVLLGSCATKEAPAGWAIENVTVIDAAHGAREHQTVIIDGDQIVAVDDAETSPDVAEVVDGSGKYLIPGLWDMHVHLTYDSVFTAAMPALFLSYGITSVRDTGGLLANLLPVVTAMREDGAVAPRVFFSGPLLDGASVVYDGDERPHIGISNPSVEDARANVALLKAQGADFIKIYELVSPDVFESLVEAAADHDLPIAAHVPLSLQASEVAPRVNSMEHLRNVELDCAAGADDLLTARRDRLARYDEGPGAPLRSRLHELQRLPAIAAYDEARCDEVLASMTSTIQVPTLRLNAFHLQPPFSRDDWLAALEQAPETIAEDWQAATKAWRAEPPSDDTTFAAWSLSLVGQMHDQGVPIGAGTDTPINYALPGYSLHSELEMLVRAGLSPLEALRSATVRPAEFFNLEDEMGTVEAGKRADLVLLSANPLDDIRHTRQIEAVVSKGSLLTKEDLAQLRP